MTARLAQGAENEMLGTAVKGREPDGAHTQQGGWGAGAREAPQRGRRGRLREHAGPSPCPGSAVWLRLGQQSPRRRPQCVCRWDRAGRTWGGAAAPLEQAREAASQQPGLRPRPVTRAAGRPPHPVPGLCEAASTLLPKSRHLRGPWGALSQAVIPRGGRVPELVQTAMADSGQARRTRGRKGSRWSPSAGGRGPWRRWPPDRLRLCNQEQGEDVGAGWAGKDQREPSCRL